MIYDEKPLLTSSITFSQFVFCQNLNEKYNELRKEVNNSPDNVIKESRILKEKALKTNTFAIVSKADYITSFAFYLKGSRFLYLLCQCCY